ncbi:redoxin domain-containing protein [Lysobacter sp. CFH 32150]|uniref:TlpA family protein disulfide reductase n=1 Tax=Lysobacter sp. CFH 32150 TaxID=2927128 RepID=UPI001FA72FA7|nr:redoxin domain-containing protein [Lysobacter sp. CFH 32150]MCI4568856.1 redoxin domain-containing protein [Lysobacter sp. CFH 32150]
MSAILSSLHRHAWARRLAAAGVSAVMLLSHGAPTARAETGQDYAKQAGTRLVGRVAPTPRLATIDGKTIDLAALRGRKAVYLKFWATWCVPCRDQMPHFEKVKRTAGDDLEVVAINIGFDDTLAQIEAYRREHGLTMPIVRDDDGRLGELFGLRVTPQHVVIGKEGRIQYVGHLADARLDAALASARQSSASDSRTAAMSPPSSGQQAAPVTARIGDVVPSLTVKTLEGYEIALKDPAGKRETVLAFLSPWCEGYFEKTRPRSSKRCRSLREQLVALGRDRSVRWVGIASGLWASEQDLHNYRNEHGIPVPLTLDREGALFRRFGIHRVPAVIVVDAGGRIVGQVDVDELKGGHLQQSARATRARGHR